MHNTPEPLGPIPTPLMEHWRRIRFKFMNMAGFLVVCCGIAVTWRYMAQPLTFPGQAEIIQASVTSPERGVLTNLLVGSFQEVKAGQPIAELHTTRTGSRDYTCSLIPLCAPMDGVVAAIHHYPGEQILAGQTIATITSQESRRILGFVPPGFPSTPEVGMKVEIRTRSRLKKTGIGKILGIGPRWESVTNILAYSSKSRFTPGQAIGRPVSISVPSD